MASLLTDVLGKTNLSLEDIGALVASSRLITFKKGELILAEGALCQQIYFIEKGCVRKHHFKDGKSVNLDFFLEGSFFTNLKSLREQSTSTYSISAYEGSLVAAFSGRAMLDLYESYPAIRTYGSDIIAKLSWEQEEHSDFLKLNSPLERYQHLIEKKPELFKRIPISQLASYLGTSRETLCRIRKIR